MIKSLHIIILPLMFQFPSTDGNSKLSLKKENTIAGKRIDPMGYGSKSVNESFYTSQSKVCLRSLFSVAFATMEIISLVCRLLGPYSGWLHLVGNKMIT